MQEDNEELSDEAVSKIFENAVDVLNHCPNPGVMPNRNLD